MGGGGRGEYGLPARVPARLAWGSRAFDLLIFPCGRDARARPTRTFDLQPLARRPLPQEAMAVVGTNNARPVPYATRSFNRIARSVLHGKGIVSWTRIMRDRSVRNETFQSDCALCSALQRPKG